jgi:hypothetical protein
VRRVTKSELVEAVIKRTSIELPRFRIIFEEGVMWQLQRSPLGEAAVIPTTDPPIFVIESNAWRADGIPVMRIGFIKLPQDDIEIVSLSFRPLASS